MHFATGELLCYSGGLLYVLLSDWKETTGYSLGKR
jgi:hypothetical protein